MRSLECPRISSCSTACRCLMVPVLMAFKYGKPRGYVRDLAFWYMKPHAYCALARDREIRSAYLREE